MNQHNFIKNIITLVRDISSQKINVFMICSLLPVIYLPYYHAQQLDKCNDAQLHIDTQEILIKHRVGVKVTEKDAKIALSSHRREYIELDGDSTTIRWTDCASNYVEITFRNNYLIKILPIYKKEEQIQK